MYEKMNKLEAKVVKEIVKRAIEAGYLMTVFDGEEIYNRSNKFDVIIDSMMNTDEDVLSLYTPETDHSHATYVGAIHFVYGNSAEEVVCDHSDNKIIRSIVRGL